MNGDGTEIESLRQRAAITAEPDGESDANLFGELRRYTPARIGLRRSGSSLATGEVLNFQLAHARARDAVHAALQPAGVAAALGPLFGGAAMTLHSAAPNRKTYLQRPDLGRRLDEASRHRLDGLNAAKPAFQVAIVVVDGLSALAIERHAVPLLAEVLPRLKAESPSLRLAPICIVEQGRVAVGDEVALLLEAEMVAVLIGERPGLSSADSLGIYITWLPPRGGEPATITDADRNCISNIRQEGLSYAEAALRMLFYVRAARHAQQTGTGLKEADADFELKLDVIPPQAGNPA